MTAAKTTQRATPPGPRSARLTSRRRSRRDLLLGGSALLLLICLLVGVPFALLTFSGVSLPRALPTLNSLQQPISARTLINVLGVVLWLAWIQFAACVIVEVAAEVRGVGLPARVPLAGGTQALSHRLVATALLLFTVTATLAPAVVANGWAARGPAISSQATVRAGSNGGAATSTDPRVQAMTSAVQNAAAGPKTAAGAHSVAATAKVAARHATKLHTVQPPHGRHHESLWEIAERHLGDGRRYPEIFELNKDRVQPDGSRLTIASLIRPGWVLRMPAGAFGIDEAAGVAHEVTAPHPGAAAVAPVAHEHAVTEAAAQAPGHLATGGGGATSTVPAVRLGQPDRPGLKTGVEQSRDASAPSLLMRELAAASLLGAGLLVALGRRRRRQLWRRTFGTRLAHPDGDAAVAEQTLLLAADATAARALDRALRSLSVASAARDMAPPAIYAARVTGAEIVIHLAPADRFAPEPWTADDDGSTWRLALSAVSGLPASAGDALAPYPGLVCIGQDSSGHVLLDLEAAHGVIALTGTDERRVEVLAAMAAELATNLWSDHLRVTLVGFGSELTVLAPDRVRATDTLADVLAELELRAAETAQALATIGADSVLTGRSRGVAGDAWMPHFVLVAGTPTADELTRLSALAGQGRRNPTGFVVAGDVPRAAWSLDLAEGDDVRMTVVPLGLDVEAQRLPQPQYAAVVGLFETAARPGGVAYTDAMPLPFGTRSVPDLEAPVDVDVRVLGPIEISAPNDIDEDRRAICTEVLVYLALQPEGVHPTVLGSAIWPRGVTAGVRDSAIARVRDWLGRDSAGRPHLAVGEDGRLVLGPGVRCDWTSAQLLMRLASLDGHQEASGLASALGLVRGALLADRPTSRYTWLAGVSVPYEVSARLADAAHRLAEIELSVGNPSAAIAAIRQGLLIADDDEQLWQDLLRAAHATGDPARLREIAGEIARRSGDDMGDLNPHTEALVDELYPSWRISAVR